MNYQRLHDALVAVGRQRGTKERNGFDLHHVIPSCMGGSDDESNKALLTFHEHFVLHRILTKLYPSHKGLHCAVWRMTNDGKHKKSGRAYEKARQNFIDNHPRKTPKARVAQSKRWEGDSNPARKPENRKTASERWEGDKHPMKKLKNRLAKARQAKLQWEGDGNPAKKQKNRDATGNRNSQAHAEGKHPMQKLENRAASSERMKEQVQCSHCGKVGSRGIYRYHFNNCLQHPDNLGLTRKQIADRRKQA